MADKGKSDPKPAAGGKPAVDPVTGAKSAAPAPGDKAGAAGASAPVQAEPLIQPETVRSAAGKSPDPKAPEASSADPKADGKETAKAGTAPVTAATPAKAAGKDPVAVGGQAGAGSGAASPVAAPAALAEKAPAAARPGSEPAAKAVGGLAAGAEAGARAAATAPTTGPAAAAVSKSAAPPPAKRRSALPLLLAGVVTAAIGFGAAWALWRPGGLLAGDTAAAEARLASLDQRLAAAETALGAKAAANDVTELDQRTEAVEAALAGLAGQGEALQALETRSQEVSNALTDLGNRLTDLAQRPPESDPAAVAAYERELAAIRQGFETELAAIRAMVAAELARIQAATTEAAAASEESEITRLSAETAAALAGIGAALEAGTPLAGPLDRLAELRPDLDTAPLRDWQDGVPTLLALQQAFPGAARAALAAEVAAGGGETGLVGGLKGFFGVRTLTPREGDDTDAVLSRAEAALASGDLAGALTVLDVLAPVPAAELAAWRELAAIRLAALTAHATLKEAVEK